MRRSKVLSVPHPVSVLVALRRDFFIYPINWTFYLSKHLHIAKWYNLLYNNIEHLFDLYIPQKGRNLT